MFALWNKIIVIRTADERKITKVRAAPHQRFLKSFSQIETLPSTCRRSLLLRKD